MKKESKNKNKNMLVSIIVPVFNIEAYISECIESIQNQTYQNLQIILVDDGSTDQSGIICDSYALADSRIEVIHQHNKGPVAARKNGLDKAKGKYIGFVDGDDYIDPDMYEMLIQDIEKSKADFVHSGYWEGTAKKNILLNEIIDLWNDRVGFFEKVVLGNFLTPSNWSKLYLAEVIKKAYGRLEDDCILGEDLLALCICILECDKISVIDGCYYHYRVREGSLSHRRDISDLKNVYKLYEDLCNVLKYYGLYKDLEAVMDKFLWDIVMNYMARINQNDFQIAKYYFRDIQELYGKRIVIYGAGGVGRDYYAQICRYSDCEVVAWVDAYPERYQYKHINLCGVDILDSIKFDMLIIAILKETVVDDICDELIARGIDKEKIYWSEPGRWGIE